MVVLLAGLLGLPSIEAAESKQSESKTVGKYIPAKSGEPESLLLRRGEGQEEWQRLDKKHARIAAGDTLVSLPGFRSTVEFQNGLRATLWSDLPEFTLFTPLRESRIVVQDNGRFDLDLTLERGRVALANKLYRDARVRVRFPNPAVKNGQEVWEITLSRRNSAVTLDLFGQEPAGSREKTKGQTPEIHLYMIVLKGQAIVKMDGASYTMKEPPAKGLLLWRSTRGNNRPASLKKLPAWTRERFSPFPKGLDRSYESYLKRNRTAMAKALREFAEQMKDKEVEAALTGALKSGTANVRALAVRGFGAIDDLDHLLGALADRKKADVRLVAVETLRHLLESREGSDRLLRKVLKKKDYSTEEADAIMEMLHTYSMGDLNRPATFARLIDRLRDDRPAIRQLAHWHLVFLVPEGQRIKYDPVGSTQQQERAYSAWKKLVPDGKLPRPPKRPKRPQ